MILRVGLARARALRRPALHRAGGPVAGAQLGARGKARPRMAATTAPTAIRAQPTAAISSARLASSLTVKKSRVPVSQNTHSPASCAGCSADDHVFALEAAGGEAAQVEAG